MNPRIITLTAGHLVALALGISVARAWPRLDGKSPAARISASHAADRAAAENEHGAARVSRRAKPAEVPANAAVLKGAWQEMQRQSPADRARLRPQLLARWAEVDLAGALEAALLEPDSRELLAAFDDLFQKHPEVFQPLLAGERFGLKSATFRDWWIVRMGGSNPDGLLASIGSFNESDQKKIVEQRFGGAAHDAESKWALVGDFAKFADTPANRKLWALAARAATAGEKPETVIEKLSAIPGAVGDVMLAEAMTVMLEKTDYAGARATYARLPADLKPQIVQAALRVPGSNAGSFLAAVDEVIGTADWSRLQKPLAAKLHDMSPSSDQFPMMLDWAAKLPERDDTLDIYRVAVRKFVTYQPDQAREWIGAMPGGWKRQNSLTAYAQAALFARDDVAGADWARQQIVDPGFRVQADEIFKIYNERNKPR